MPDEIMEEVRRDTQIEQVVLRSLDEAIAQADVLYMTRIQKERFATQQEYEQVSGVYRLDAALMTKVLFHCIFTCAISLITVCGCDCVGRRRRAWL